VSIVKGVKGKKIDCNMVEGRRWIHPDLWRGKESSTT
jgi:hypothetical protein